MLEEVGRIEQSTPFIKEGNDSSTLTGEQLKIEQKLCSVSKKDLEFFETKEANLGKGSYGEV